jgi:phosphoribosyl 1,2-cyclic phosphodiesterase
MAAATVDCQATAAARWVKPRVFRSARSRRRRWTELPEGAAFGHAAAEYAVALDAVAGAGTVVLFHHSHRRTDAMLDLLADRYRDHTGRRVVVGAEGTVIDLGGR